MPRTAREMALEARKYSIEAIHVLVKLMRNGDTAAVKASAANSILDRAYGKPAQNIDMLVSKQISEMTESQLAELEARLVGQVGLAALEAPNDTANIVDLSPELNTINGSQLDDP
jgi:5-hydroxyisourate hydrolase-like protein (transthyretin family)